MDEYIDELLREDRMFDVILPRLQKRQQNINTITSTRPNNMTITAAMFIRKY
jgi:hypothetical protein